MQSGIPGAPFEMQIRGANKGGVGIGSDAAKSRRCNSVHISLQYERHELMFLQPFYNGLPVILGLISIIWKLSVYEKTIKYVCKRDHSSNIYLDLVALLLRYIWNRVGGWWEAWSDCMKAIHEKWLHYVSCIILTYYYFYYFHFFCYKQYSPWNVFIYKD